MTITFETITTLEQAQQLRVLRNQCAGWMTRDTAQITEAQQETFYRDKLATGRVDGFLALDDGEPAAYGLLVWDKRGRAWSSTGVAESARGRGLGRAVTVENARRAHARSVPIWAEVRQDNAGQQRICATVGYCVLYWLWRDGARIDVMRCDHLLPEYA
jgi:ribosomal protein S18 acetylase RimI-like enzyme